jgi:hypothetical protein
MNTKSPFADLGNMALVNRIATKILSDDNYDDYWKFKYEIYSRRSNTNNRIAARTEMVFALFELLWLK